jgi:hypothetical protein
MKIFGIGNKCNYIPLLLFSTPVSLYLSTADGYSNRIMVRKGEACGYHSLDYNQGDLHMLNNPFDNCICILSVRVDGYLYSKDER